MADDKESGRDSERSDRGGTATARRPVNQPRIVREREIIEHEEPDHLPAIDETHPGGVYGDKDGYHDADGNRLAKAEAEKRLAHIDELKEKRANGTEAPPAIRDANPPGRTEPGLVSSEGDPSQLESVQKAQEEQAEQRKKLAEAERESRKEREQRQREADEKSEESGGVRGARVSGATGTSTGRRQGPPGEGSNRPENAAGATTGTRTSPSTGREPTGQSGGTEPPSGGGGQ